MAQGPSAPPAPLPEGWGEMPRNWYLQSCAADPAHNAVDAVVATCPPFPVPLSDYKDRWRLINEMWRTGPSAVTHVQKYLASGGTVSVSSGATAASSGAAAASGTPASGAAVSPSTTATLQHLERISQPVPASAAARFRNLPETNASLPPPLAPYPPIISNAPSPPPSPAEPAVSAPGLQRGEMTAAEEAISLDHHVPFKRSLRLVAVTRALQACWDSDEDYI
eukprot:TRINITY_DN3687_c0_g1_i1.p1 TRINITY_DN3687_c0_g1~~TRINITY_DN3687_c0_g1_i1.p1  ORF type:complete len:246 (-),score=14.60 TRINITY_DN3687_c0_g1_i1:555-1223(-)